MKNWEKSKRSFHDDAATLQAHKISNMRAQTKRAIKEDVNSPLFGKVPNKRRATDKVKTLSAFKLGGQEEENNSDDHVHFKVWKMTTQDDQYTLRPGNSVNIGIVRDDTYKTGKPGGGICTQIPRRTY